MAKRPSTDLFYLIKSLNRNEKGYFKKFVSRHSIKSKNNYVKLFDAIDKQKKYDEEKLIRKETYIKQLPLLKNYLYQMVLESLENYYSGSKVRLKLYSTLTRINILYNKALYDQCRKLVRQGKKLAYLYDEFAILHELIKWEKDLSGYDLTDKKLADILHEDESVARESKRINDLHNLSLKVYGVYKNYGVLGEKQGNKKLQKLLQDPALAEENMTNFTARSYHYYIHGFCNFIMRDWYASYKYRKELVNHFESIPKRISENPTNYLAAIHNLLTVCDQLNMKEEFFTYLAKLRSVADIVPETDTRVNKTRIFASSHNLELNWYISRGEFEKAMDVARYIEGVIYDYKDMVNMALILLNMFNISLVYFGTGNYEKALKWINRTLSDQHINQLSPQTDFKCRLLNLMIQYEGGNYSVLEGLVKATYRHVYTKPRTYKLELFITDLFRKLTKSKHDAVKQQQIFTAFRKDFPEIREGSYEQVIFEGFDFLAWVDSHIAQQTFSTTLKAKMAFAE